MRSVRSETSLISKRQREKSIKEIIGYFQSSRNEKIGIIAAEKILELLLETAGKEIYNQGVRDTRQMLRSRLEDFDVDVEAILIKQ